MKKIIIILTLLNLALFLSDWLLIPEPIKELSQNQFIVEKDMEDQINAYRMSKGKEVLPEGQWSCGLALVRLSDIKKQTGGLSHKGFSERVRQRNGYNGVGENLASGYRSGSEVVSGWIESPLHEDNLVGNWKEMCIHGENGYWVFIGMT